MIDIMTYGALKSYANKNFNNVIKPSKYGAVTNDATNGKIYGDGRISFDENGSTGYISIEAYDSLIAPNKVIHPYLIKTTDGGSTFRTVLKDAEIPPNDTLQMDKPLNLEAGDIIRIYGTSTNMECFLSILELT